MDDPPKPAGVAPARDMLGWSRGRASRAEYWTYVALQTALGLLLTYATPVVSLGLVAVYILVQMRRLHDFGRSGWWALGAFFGTLVPLVPLTFLAGEDVAMLGAMALTLIATIWIGVVPGDTGDNRFGPPPPFSVRRVLIGR
jgi:uncharacterized membrane protein YhaH (DUF805 family)